MSKNFYTSLLFIFLTTSAFATEKKIDEMSLEELMNVKVSVASNKETTTRNSPGIVSLITAEEIAHSGARDLFDLLLTVPGFSFGSDVQGVTGLGFRGIWGLEGKILLLIDGLEMDENLYGTLEFGNHFPLNLIERIEIIRGPGSAIYGGNAELAVIKITTKGANELNGFNGTLTYGQTDKTYARRNLELGIGKVSGDWSYSATGMIGQAQMSDRNYTDSNGSTYSFQSNSAINPAFLNLAASYGDLHARLIYDSYHTKDKTAFGTNLSIPLNTNYTNILTKIDYQFKINPQFSITPELSFKINNPYQVIEPQALEVSGEQFDISATRTKFKIGSSYDFSNEINLTAGIEGFRDSAINHLGNFQNGFKTVRYDNEAAFAQLSAESGIANFTVGARYEGNSGFDSSFVPRFSVMKQMGSFHTKLLYSKAFKSPNIENINFAPNGIKPEKTSVAEIELGNQFSDHFFFSTNFFKIAIDQPIVYDYVNGDSYSNYSHTGTRGFEVEGKYKDTWGLALLNYSYYQADGNDVDAMSVPGESDSHLALPTNKASISANLNFLGENYWLNPALIYVGSRYGYDYDVASSSMIIKKFNPTWLANLYFEKRSFILPQFNLGLGIFNLLNQNYNIIQAYNGGHPPLPGLSREYVLKLNYAVNF